MKKVIFSLYIDIPENDLDYQPPYPDDDIPKTLRTKYALKNNYDFLKQRQQEYASKIGVDYILYEYDDEYKSYLEMFLKKYPFITAYNVVNFYKIQKLYDLSEKYDELLYLDFDVIPTNTNNFFESFDLNKGIAIQNNFKDHELQLDYDSLMYHHLKKSIKYKDIQKSEESGKSNRSPESKYWNAMALNVERCGVTRSSSYNTGIIGATSSNIKKLNYWENFSELLNFMTELKDDEMWPEQLRRYFGWDNETIWGHRVELNSVNTQELGDDWHFRFWREYHIPQTINFIHALNKDFDYVKKWLEENDKINL